MAAEFKVDSPGLWEALVRGQKNWEARFVDEGDQRWASVLSVMRLTLLFTGGSDPLRMTFRVLAIRPLPEAPGWVLIQLGKREA